jgi:hypothetical protein
MVRVKGGWRSAIPCRFDVNVVYVLIVLMFCRVPLRVLWRFKIIKLPCAARGKTAECGVISPA